MPYSNSLESGRKVGGGRFTLVKPLGRGGMGEVWLAQDERLGEPVALKFLPPEIRGDARALDDLRRETARSHRLTHTNIIRIHDLNEIEGEPAFIAMEYIDGPTLTGLQMQQTDRVLGWDFLKPLVQQLCTALDYAHGENVVHRDLKPANIMVDGKGRLKLADFGIAATLSDSVSRVSLRHATSGTLPYMSPQQLAGKHPSVADDIYALGATLYELLSSKPPFYTGDLTHQVLHESPEPLQERLKALGIQNSVPPDVAAIVMACLAKDPMQRPQSARAVAEWVGLEVVSKPSLQNLSDEMLGVATAAEQAGPSQSGDVRAPPPRSRRNILIGGVTSAALILIGLGGWYWKIRPSAGSRNPPQGQSENTEPDSNSTQVAAISDAAPPTTPAPSDTEAGFISLFNGHDLSGWDGDPRFWSVENGLLKGQSTEGNIPEGNNTYLIWTNGVVDDFELRLSYKLVYGDLGSGIQYRGRRITGWVAQGYQADFWPISTGNSGLLAYEAPGGGGRPAFGRLAAPGENVIWGADGKKRVIGHTAKSGAEIQAAIKEGEWNEYVVTARGNHLIHEINGNITMEMTDNDPQRRFMSGLIGLKMRNNKARPMLIYFKDLRLKRLTKGASTSVSPASTDLWIPLFDGKTLSGWTTPDGGGWSIAQGGILIGKGQKSHLFSPGVYTNLEFKAEVKLNHGGNSGMFFRVGTRANRPGGYPKGYEAQIANTAGDPVKTGSLYYFHKITEQLVQDDTWCTQHLIAIGNRIVIKVDNRIVTDFIDEKNTYTAGCLALQQNHPATVVQFRNVLVKPLSAEESMAWLEARKDMPDLPP